MSTLYSQGFGGVTPLNDFTGVAGIWSNPTGVLQNDSGVGTLNSIYVSTGILAAVADCKVTCKRVSGTGWDGGPVLRWSGGIGSETGYYLDANNTSMQVYRRVAGADTAVGTAATGLTLANADTYALQSVTVGSTVVLKMYQNGVQRGSDAVDSSGSRITAAGSPGVCTWATTAQQFDDLLVETASAGISIVLLATGHYRRRRLS